MYKRYRYFDYWKVLNILKKFKTFLGDKQEYYHIEILSFKDVSDEKMNPFVLDFSEYFTKESLNFFNAYPLVTCGLYLGECTDPIFSFFMQEDICKIEFYFTDSFFKGKRLDEILTSEEISDKSWENCITIFINKVNAIIKMELTIQIDLNLNHLN